MEGEETPATSAPSSPVDSPAGEVQSDEDGEKEAAAEVEAAQVEA